MAEALRHCHIIVDPELDWTEEPILYDDLDGYAQLAAQVEH